MKKTHVPQIAPRTLARTSKVLSKRLSIAVKVIAKNRVLHLTKMRVVVKMIVTEIAKSSAQRVTLTSQRK